MNRRTFLHLALASFALRAQERRRTLVFLFLPGGLDGLSVVVPDDPRLVEMRPAIAHPAPGKPAASAPDREALLPLESGLGLHPSLRELLPLYRDGVLAFVHAVGQPSPTRSHFDAQDYLELGTPGVKSTRDGWLARALRLSSPSGSPLEAVALSQALPRSLYGSPRAFAVSSLGAARLRPLAGGPRGAEGRTLSREAFDALYLGSSLAGPAHDAFAALEMIERRIGEIPKGPNPYGPAGRALREVAALVKADVGLRVAFVSAGGWDTHAGQPGELSRRLAGLGGALAAFWKELGPRADDVLLVAATEFGRTARQNGSLGTDHGHGSIALALGGRVAGGKVYGRWPGLGPAELYEGRDLDATTDLRAFLATATEAQLGATSGVFPGYTGAKLSYLR